MKTNQSMLSEMRMERWDKAERLLLQGADVNERSWDGMTPLHVAVCCRKADWVRNLLARGARLDVKDGFGELPIQYPSTAAIRALLKQAGGSAPSAKKRRAVRPAFSYAKAFSKVARREGPAEGVLRLRDFDAEPRTYQLLVFDWRKVGKKMDAFFGDLFGDGFREGFLEDSPTGLAWTSEEIVPFAFANVTPYKRFEVPSDLMAILFFDLKHGRGSVCPILSVSVEGTAHPDGFRKVAPRIEALGLRRAGKRSL